MSSFITIPADHPNVEDIRDLLRYKDPNARFSKAYKSGNWDGFKQLTRLRKGELVIPVGFVELIREQPWGEDFPALPAPPPPGELYSRTQLVELDSIQEEAVELALEHGSGLIQAPTGLGKGRAIGEIIRRLGMPALVLCDQVNMLEETSLAGQIHAAIGERVGRIGGGAWREENCTVATYQTLTRRKKADILSRCPVVIVDEVQHTVADTYQAVLERASASRRLGFSATVFKSFEHGKSRDKSAWYRVQQWLGPLIFQASISDGVEAERIVPASIGIIHGCDWKGSAQNYREEYQLGIVENAARNKAIVQLRRRLEGQMAVIVQSLEHGEYLAGQLGTVFVSGTDKSSLRQEFFEGFKAGQYDTIVLSKIADESLDLPNIELEVLAGGGNSPYRQIQKIGRALRAHEGKTEALVFDFEDYGKYISAHSRRRRRTYEAEEAYTVYDIELEELNG
jgi:DNA excision repair protein ERCC-3